MTSSSNDVSSSGDTIRIAGFPYLKGRRFSLKPLLGLALVDWFFLLLLGKQKPAACPSLAGKTIAVSKIDLLGDVLMITPFLRELRTQAPSCRICLVIGSWSKEIGSLLLEEKLCDSVTFYDPFLMNPSEAWLGAKLSRWLKTFRRSWSFLRREAPSIYIDFRSYSPNSLLLARLAGVPHKIGFGLRGYSYFLQQELAYSSDVAMGQSYLDALPLLNLRTAEYRKPILSLSEESPKTPELASTYIAVHPFSRDPRKMLPPEFWREILLIMTQTSDVLLLGSKDDLASTDLLATFLANRRVKSAVGTTSFRGALDCVQGCTHFLGLDSVFSHVALAFDKPCFVLGRQGVSFRQAFPKANPLLRYSEVGSETSLSSADRTSIEQFFIAV